MFLLWIVCKNIFVVNINQLTARVDIFTFCMQESFNGLLLTVWKFHKILIRSDTAININSFKSAQVTGDMILFHFFRKIWNVELIAIEVNQIAVIRGKICKGTQYIFFIFIVGGKPLYRIPCRRLFLCIIVDAANQIKRRAFGIESGSFYIYKKCLLRNTEILNGISGRQCTQTIGNAFHSELFHLSVILYK